MCCLAAYFNLDFKLCPTFSTSVHQIKNVIKSLLIWSREHLWSKVEIFIWLYYHIFSRKCNFLLKRAGKCIFVLISEPRRPGDGHRLSLHVSPATVEVCSVSGDQGPDRRETGKWHMMVKCLLGYSGGAEDNIWFLFVCVQEGDTIFYWPKWEN